MKAKPHSLKTALLTLVLTLLVAGAAQAQLPKLRRLDVGVELLRINLPQLEGAKAPQLNSVKVLPGLTFRYGAGRWGVRAGLQFTHNANPVSDSSASTTTDFGQDSDVGIRIGAEFSLPRYRNWIYAIADARAHRYESRSPNSAYWRENNTAMHRRTLGVGSQLGLGLRLRLTPRVVLGQETLLDIGIERALPTQRSTLWTAPAVDRSPNLIFLRPLARVYIAVNL